MGVQEVHGHDQFQEIVRVARRVSRCMRADSDALVQIKKDTYTVFDFWAPWCGPCKVIGPVFEKLSEQFKNVEFYKVNADDESEISSAVGIRAVCLLLDASELVAYGFVA